MKSGSGGAERMCSMTIKKVNFEKVFLSLQFMAENLQLGHKMRIVADYDSEKPHIKMNYLEVKDSVQFESLPDDMKFSPTKVNCGVDWKHGMIKGSGGLNREFSEANLQNVLELMGFYGMCGTKGKVRVIVDYDPDKEEIFVKHIIPVE